MKLTPAQAALLHTVESAASSAILTFVVGLVQYLGTHQLNGADLATVFASGFVAAFGLIYKSVLSSPALAQAESDTVNELKTAVEQRFSNMEAMFTTHTHASLVPLPVAPASVPQVAYSPTTVAPLTFNSTSASVPPVATLPPRSFNDSALMPAVNLNTPVQPAK